MKKFPVLILSVLLLTGCAEKTDNSCSEIVEIPETTAETEISETVTQPTKIASRKEFVVTEDGIQVIRDGEIFQVLEDTNLFEVSGQLGDINVHPEDCLVKRDFDGDGCMDLFVPYLFSVIGETEKGVYYHRNPNTAELEKWDAFNEIGVYLTSSNTIADTFLRRPQFRKFADDNLKYFILNSDESESIYYSYDKTKDKLEYAGKEITYTDSDGEEYTDTFLKSYITGEEQLVCRKKDTEEIFVHPSQCYIRTEENKISVIWHMCSEGYDTIQTFEGNYKAHKDPVGHCTPPENTASFKDMNGDGYNDIYIEEGECAGDYFRFNPDTFRFDEKTEVSANEDDIRTLPDDFSTDNLDVVHNDMNFHHLSEPPYFIRHLENEDIYYKSDNDNLNYMGRITTYTGEDGLNYADTYFQPKNKEEQLICRKQITGDTEKEIFVHPFQCFFTVKDNSINIFLRETDELIQTIETDCRLCEEQSGHCTPPVHYVKFKDVNNDGYDDIYIDDGEGAGKYFCFNPETFRFDEV